MYNTKFLRIDFAGYILIYECEYCGAVVNNREKHDSYHDHISTIADNAHFDSFFIPA